MISILDRKLWRDLLRMWAQVLAIGLVLGCGVATILIAVGASRSLEDTRAAFYDRYRFATVFASLTRAPLVLRQAIGRIEGVSAVELRVVRPVLLDIPAFAEPATGLVVSIPDRGEPAVNRLYLRSGRLPEPGRAGEVAVTEPFAVAQRMGVGSTFQAIMNGRKQALTVTGVVLSPEFIYAVGPGDMMPDQRRFGVLYMPRSTLAGVFDMEGAFNDIALRTRRGADLRALIDALDGLTKPYGGTGAYERADQFSHAFVEHELNQLRAMASVIPPVFLFVSTFLVNMVLSRLIILEREQIGLLKAVGYGRLQIGWHYGKLTLVITAIGLAVGAYAGNMLGIGLTRLYVKFYSFPFLIFRQSMDLYMIAGGAAVVAAFAGAARAIWSVVALPPAVAMLPPAPTRYRSLFGGGTPYLRAMSQLTVMALRHIVRWPVRTLMTVFGTSLSVALLVMALFSFDSLEFMIDTMFFRAERQDVMITFGTEAAPRGLQAAARLPGVLRAEPFRTAPVILSSLYRSKRLSISGIPEHSDLVQVLDERFDPVALPPSGLLVSERVAKLLHLEVGDLVEVELLERHHRVEAVPVTAVIQSFTGLAVFMHLEALDRLLGDGPRIGSVRLAIDGKRVADLYRVVKQTPEIASVALLGNSRARFRDTIEENMTMMVSVYAALAVIITFGVIYNTARIQLSERARELACLRVLGFTKGEVSGVLLLELALIVAASQPLGWIAGYGLSWLVVHVSESDLFRIPHVIERSTFATASLVVIAIAAFSAFVVRRRVDRLDLVRVLTTRE